MKTVVILDYGMSNLRSVNQAFTHVAERDWNIIVSNEADTIFHADKIVFPGQGAIGNCMALLNKTGLSDIIRRALQEKPFLGLCLGLQTLLTHSEENGGVDGFDAIAGTVKHFPEPLLDPLTGERQKVPHMGWNQVKQVTDHPLWANIPDNSRFYFVHSYYVEPTEPMVTTGATTYGSITFTSAIAHNNLCAVQFHPEKSQHTGLQLLKNFLAL
ncbi:imidazole glycerol phosphate synthase subunit HisH [Beggiatoa leptomitoformis]|uniref:Imidazole glycerol phosphate synthase subunit HisH n=1 Tax=Beggiatoa leptomitoformis TaxID=288004 RepID=A0A2N9YEG8_9GAMM|nr:imidazole glycerol phosphate synthase subunit HisH [Beggiatoa leptomitoformis]ALG68785.1 imidazole glycerol phosphate synthase subunit HisH [Beggiatoa leptomitoformis]AUI68854.1 imidazole glycerol phosphate synthase subunit HisH [Beggiatoa leptomitoformis]